MKSKMTMKQLPLQERPYEKCLAQGAEALTDAELLAIVLRTGSKDQTSLEMAREILTCCPYEQGLESILHLKVHELKKIRGVGTVKAIQLKCIAEISKRLSQMYARKSLCFQNAHSIADYYMERLCHEEQEHVLSIMLDTRNHLLGECELTRGTVNQSILPTRELFIEALSYHAVNLILVHNHPSGDPTPSKEDLLATERVKTAGDLIGIKLLDHIVIGDHCYYSIAAHEFS